MTDAYIRIAVCGAGAMGSGIAQVAAQHGAEVTIFDLSPAAASASEARIAKSLDDLAAKGRIDAEDARQIRQRLRWVGDLEPLATSDLVIEAIVEDLQVKADLFARVEAIVSRDAAIASNTSSLPIARLARGLARPERFVGMHFFNPATVMKLVEVVAGPATDPAVVARTVATAKAWGKVAVPVADVPGFIVNRVARPFYAEAFAALQEGAATAAEIDALFRAAGFRMGPLELTDFIGQDVNFAVARSVYESYFGRTRFVPQLNQAALVDAGWLGRKSGRGVYDYSVDAHAWKPPAPGEDSGDGGAYGACAEALAALPPGDLADCDGVLVGTTSGRTARAVAGGVARPVALLDWALAGSDGPIGFAATNQDAAHAAHGVLAAMGRPAIRLADRPGLVVCRTLAQIVNAAADAVFEKVSDEAGIDAALRFGANYPWGPFAWADRVGRGFVTRVLCAVADGTGQSLYFPSQHLRDWS